MVSIKRVDFIRDGILLVCVTTAFGYLTTPNNPFLTGIPAHPYFVVVLLMAARYGMMVGMGSAFVLAILYILGGLAQPGDKSVFPLLLEAPHSITISGLFLFAVIAGGFTDMLRRQIKDAEAKKKEDMERLIILEQQNDMLTQTNQELRDQIMEDGTSFHTLFEMAQKICALDGKILFSTIMDILEEHLNAERCSLYLLRGPLLHLVAYHGWDKVLEQDKIISIDHCQLIKTAVKEKRLVSLKDFVYREELTFRDRIMAAPVCSKTDGKVIGVITIDKIPFDRFNPQTLQIFSIIADWASKALADPAYTFSGQEQ